MKGSDISCYGKINTGCLQLCFKGLSDEDDIKRHHDKLAPSFPLHFSNGAKIELEMSGRESKTRTSKHSAAVGDHFEQNMHSLSLGKLNLQRRS